ncbi:MAG: hypothetical protein AB8E82_14640 [Aureispira sp.]
MKFPIFALFSNYFMALIVGSFLLVACQGEPSAQEYAQRLCACYSADTDAALQLRTGTIDRTTYDQLVLDCMGEENPLQQLEDDPQALLKFKVAFLDTLEATCPDVARSIGY